MGRVTGLSDASWVPARVRWTPEGPVVDWCHLGDLRFTGPFFEQTIGKALDHPFNLLFARSTPLEALEAKEFDLRPAGLIFHMSRCGSTLISQMLASLPYNVVLSEPGPIDQILRIVGRRPDIAHEMLVHWLRIVTAALGRRRHLPERDLFIKFEGWHVLVLPLIRRAFPEVPWIFLYRDPLEILVSLDRLRPRQMLPPPFEAPLPGLNAAETEAMSPVRFSAVLLGRLCRAAIEHYGGGGGILVEYRELPDAMFTRLLDHFGLRYNTDELGRMREAARFDAKRPGQRFVDDSEEKRQLATDEMRELAATLLMPLYAQLEALRNEGRVASRGA